MKKALVLASILLFSISSLAGEDSKTLRSSIGEEPGLEAPFSDEPMNSESSPADASVEASVEQLMMKKIDMVDKAEQIDKIEAAISASEPLQSVKQVRASDRDSYRPLQDSAGKQVQSAPPFKISN